MLIVLLASADGGQGFLASIPAGLWAVIGTIIGTIGLRLLEKYLNRHSDKSAARRDFNSEVKDLTVRLDTVEAEVTFWRNRFYEEQEDNASLRVMMIQAGLTPPTKRVEPPSNASE